MPSWRWFEYLGYLNYQKWKDRYNHNPCSITCPNISTNTRTCTYTIYQSNLLKKIHTHQMHNIKMTIMNVNDIPVKLNPRVSVESFAIEFSMSHLPTITQVPHIIVRSKTVDPASKPIPTETWLWAVSLLPESPDTKIKTRSIYQKT